MKIAWIHQYKDLKTTIKRAKSKGLITESSNSTDNIRINGTVTRKQKWEEKNCMDISNDKLTRSHMKRLRPGYKRKTIRQ